MECENGYHPWIHGRRKTLRHPPHLLRTRFPRLLSIAIPQLEVSPESDRFDSRHARRSHLAFAVDDLAGEIGLAVGFEFKGQTISKIPRGGGITTQGETVGELQAMITDAVSGYFDPSEAPARIKIHFEEDPVLLVA